MTIHNSLVLLKLIKILSAKLYATKNQSFIQSQIIKKNLLNNPDDMDTMWSSKACFSLCVVRFTLRRSQVLNDMFWLLWFPSSLNYYKAPDDHIVSLATPRDKPDNISLHSTFILIQWFRYFHFIFSHTWQGEWRMEEEHDVIRTMVAAWKLPLWKVYQCMLN